MSISQYPLETFEKPPFLPNLCVPGGRDLRFVSTGSNFNPPKFGGGLIRFSNDTKGRLMAPAESKKLIGM